MLSSSWVGMSGDFEVSWFLKNTNFCYDLGVERDLVACNFVVCIIFYVEAFVFELM